MTSIDARTLYTADELRELIGETLFRRVRRCALCQNRFWGAHIIAALDSMGDDGAHPAHEPATDTRVAHSGRKGGVECENRSKIRIDPSEVA